MRKKKESEPKPASEQIVPERRSLQTYSDYVDLIEDTINGVLTKQIDSKTANSVGMLTGYGLQAIRESSGGKLKMSVFLKDMSRVRVELLSADEMDRFLQGDENVQIEVLQQLEERGGIITTDVEIIAKNPPAPKTDMKLLSNLSGIEQSELKDVLNGDVEELPTVSRRKHEWIMAIGGSIRFCSNCGTERAILQPADMESACSGDWSLP